MYFAESSKSVWEHTVDSGHVILAHFPIALLTLAFVLVWVGYIGSLVNKHFSSLPLVGKIDWGKAYGPVWLLQIIGTILIFPTKLLGERDYDTLNSQILEDLAESHEEWGNMATNYYLAFLAFTLGLVVYRHFALNPNSAKNALTKIDQKIVAKIETTPLSKLMHMLCVKKPPVQTFWYLVLTTIGFAILSYVGYLGGVLVHEHGILAN